MATKIADAESSPLFLSQYVHRVRLAGHDDGPYLPTVLHLLGGYCDVYVQAMRASAAYGDVPVGEFVWLSFDGACMAENIVALTGGRLTAKSPAANGTAITKARTTDPALTTAYKPDIAL